MPSLVFAGSPEISRVEVALIKNIWLRDRSRGFIRCWLDIGPELDQHDLVWWIGWIVEQPRDMSCNAWPKSLILLMWEHLGKLSISLLGIPLPEAEFFHLRKGPHLHMAIFCKDNGLDIGIDRFRIGRKHIPRLVEASPKHVGTDDLSYCPHSQKIQRHCPGRDCNQVKQYEDTDRRLRNTMVSRVLLEVASFHSLTIRSHLHRVILNSAHSRDEDEALFVRTIRPLRIRPDCPNNSSQRRR